MKKLLCLLLCSICLFACENIAPSTPTMTIQPTVLNEDEENILKLFNKQHDSLLLDFNVDDTVSKMVLSFYKLKDGQWDVITQSTVLLTDTQGRILLEYDDLREHLRIAYQYDESYGSIETDKIVDSPILGYGGSSIGDKEKIQLNHNIILATQICTEKNETASLLFGTLDELASFYVSRNYEEVYIVTVEFK